MDVLACLATDPGRVVTKEELLAVVWGGAFVEEGALPQAIHSLRKALGDDARQSRYVQTIPKRGYRLLAPVELERNEAEVTGEASPGPSSLAPPDPPRGSQKVRIFQAALALVLSLALWIAWDHRQAQRGVQEAKRTASASSSSLSRISASRRTPTSQPA